MRSPLRTEADAFRFLGIVIVGAALIVGAASVNTWLGVAVAAVVVGAISWWYWRQPSPGRAPVRMLEHEHERHRILVIANETVGGRVLSEELIKRAAGRDAEILVVAPALNSPLRHWVSDEDGARAAAEERVQASVGNLTQTGLAVRGEIGDGDPLQAIEDALRTFGADEIVISTHPLGRSHWLEQGLVEHARERFASPITHVVVDLTADP
jgi:nucleotide-binding universal stress UspA family protein